MINSRRRYFFIFMLVALALVAAGEAGRIFDRIKTLRATTRKLVRQHNALAHLVSATPAPSNENAARLESDLSAAQRTLSAMQEALRGHGPLTERFRSAKIPALRTDAFFDLATFIEEERLRAKQRRIRILPTAASFGFSLYTAEGPEAGLIASVFRQRLEIQYLIDAVFEAHPHSLLSVQRERPLNDGPRTARTGPPGSPTAREKRTAVLSSRSETSADLSPDYFTPALRLTADGRSVADVTAFRLVFTGQTTSLRMFLNRLAEFELPVIVRLVEVEPAGNEGAGAEGGHVGDAAEDPSGPTPINDGENSSTARLRNAVTTPGSMVLTGEIPVNTKSPAITLLVPKALSKFTVVVEFIDLRSRSNVTVPAPASREPRGKSHAGWALHPFFAQTNPIRIPSPLP